MTKSYPTTAALIYHSYAKKLLRAKFRYIKYLDVIISTLFKQGGMFMIYPYMTLADGTEIVHTDIIVKEDGSQTVEINFERLTDAGFNTARCVLPTYQWVVKTGYTQDEIAKFEDFVKRNAHLIYRFAQNGGITVA
ncbi:MAG: hypothetical protein RR764_10255 [Oscillospiraceae bacterium]